MVLKVRVIKLQVLKVRVKKFFFEKKFQRGKILNRKNFFKVRGKIFFILKVRGKNVSEKIRKKFSKKNFEKQNFRKKISKKIFSTFTSAFFLFSTISLFILL